MHISVLQYFCEPNYQAFYPVFFFFFLFPLLSWPHWLVCVYILVKHTTFSGHKLLFPGWISNQIWTSLIGILNLGLKYEFFNYFFHFLQWQGWHIFIRSLLSFIYKHKEAVILKEWKEHEEKNIFNRDIIRFFKISVHP